MVDRLATPTNEKEAPAKAGVFAFGACDQTCLGKGGERKNRTRRRRGQACISFSHPP